MSGFSLKQNQDTYNFDLTGGATLNGNAVGKWTTNKTNQIVVTKSDGSTVAFDVGWKFDQNNHLVLSSGSTAVFDFNNVNGVQPFLATRNAVIIVRPDAGQLFSFELRGTWSVSKDNLLSVSLNGVQSTIDGFFFDPRSRFMYHFADKKNPLLASVFGFVGKWTFYVDDAGNARGKFIYDMEPDAQNKPQTGTFDMPSSIIINRSNNQLVYQYNKGTQTRQIQFVGTLAITPDFVINYALDRQTTGTGETQVNSTTFSFGAVINKKNFSGDLELLLKKQDGTTSQGSLAIRGSFRGVRGSNSLQVGFSFEQTRGADKITTIFGFAGVLQAGPNNTIQWSFASNSATKTIDLAVNADIRLGKVNIDPALNLQLANGQVVGIKFLLGVSF
jgi:hypothetical protein